MSRDPLLQLMLDDMEQAPELYRPTRFWQSGLARIIDDLDKHGVSTFRRHPSALSFYVPNYGQASYYLQHPEFEQLMEPLEELKMSVDTAWRAFLDGSGEATADYRVFLAADDPGSPPDVSSVSESAFGMPYEQLQDGPRRIGRSMLRYLRMLAMLKKHTDTEPIERVLEIGGGFGSLGEILLQSPSRDYFYLDVDIPPVGYVATRYLEAVFGPETVAGYEVTRELETISIDALAERYRCAVICPWQLPRVEGRFELFVNAASFQEMEPHVVANYARHVDRLVTHTVLLRNSRSGKNVAQSEGEIGVDVPVGRRDYLRMLPGFELLAADARVFGSLGQNGFESEVLVLQRAGAR